MDNNTKNKHQVGSIGWREEAKQFIWIHTMIFMIFTHTQPHTQTSASQRTATDILHSCGGHGVPVMMEIMTKSSARACFLMYWTAERARCLVYYDTLRPLLVTNVSGWKVRRLSNHTLCFGHCERYDSIFNYSINIWSLFKETPFFTAVCVIFDDHSRTTLDKTNISICFQQPSVLKRVWRILQKSRTFSWTAFFLALRICKF